MYEQASIFDADQMLHGKLERAEEGLVDFDFDLAERLLGEVLEEANGPGVIEAERIADRAREELRYVRTWNSAMEAVEALERESPARAAHALYDEISSADTGRAGARRRFRRALIRHLIKILEHHELFFVEADVGISDLWLGLGHHEQAWRSLKAALRASAERRRLTRVFAGPCARYAEATAARFSDSSDRLRIERQYALQAAALASLLDPSLFREDAPGPEAIATYWRDHGLHAASYGVARGDLPVVQIPGKITIINEEHRRAVRVYRMVTELERDWEDAAKREEGMKRLRDAHPDLFELYAGRLRR